jgi:pyruvate dehydrogenase E1 component alpha subunit
VDAEQVEEARRNECVGRYAAYLRRHGILHDDLDAAIRNEALETMRAGIAAAEAEPAPDPSLVFDHAYVVPPQNLREGWLG